MRRFNILHLLFLAVMGVQVYNLYCGAAFGVVDLMLFVSGPIAAVLSFIVSAHDARPREGVLVAFDALLVGSALGMLLMAVAPVVYSASFGILVAAAISAGVFAGFYCPRRYRDGLRF